MMKISRTVSLILLCFIALGSFSSCEKAGTELSDLMIIQGIGIDVTSGGYKVTVEILNNEQSGSPSGDSSAENKTKIYNATGESVASALMKLTTKSGNKPFYAQNRVIVLGETTAQRNMGDVLDFFERNYDSRASQLLCVAKGGKAEEVIRAKLLNDTVKSKILEKMLESSYEQSLVPRVRIIDAVNTMKDDTTFLCVPAVSVQKNGENQDFSLDGCAVFDKDESFCMYLSSGDAQGLAFLDNHIREGFISADLPNGQKATFVLVKGKTHYKILKENGRLHYKLNIDVVCDLEEVGGAEFFSTDDDFMEKIKSAAGATIAKTSENTIIALQSEHGGDAVRYGRRLYLYDNKEYEKLKNNWDKEFKNSITSLSVNVTIRRIGEETFHSKK
ncbi:MAG: Ger(x)C family spore germination protein [Ruminococcaceae bacterium]|nr:Ger(x)C family spore germination protein [Oscillospiraceae bacterium]